VSPRPGAARTVAPLPHPVEGTVAVPGSKSLTARLLVIAALAEGTSVIRQALVGEDTDRMLDSLRRLGVDLAVSDGGTTVTVRGAGPVPRWPTAVLDAGLAGTVARFLTPVAALGDRPVTIDGTPRMRERPMGDVITAVRALGGRVVERGRPGHLPVEVTGPVRGGKVSLAGNASSQFLSGLLLAAPALPDGLEVELTTPLVSEPYVAMTISAMAFFGVEVTADGNRRFVVEPGQRYQAAALTVEPDASAASYFFAAAAITGSRLSVRGVHRRSLQGDVRFADLLGAMGAAVDDTPTGLTVAGTGVLHGLAVDMADCSDVVQSLAVVAPFADGPTEVSGVGFIRAKETDRIGATIEQLRRCNIDASPTADGLVVRPSIPHGAVVDPVGDHRMAMSFAVLGLAVPGIQIASPEVTAKTFPAFFDELDRLHRLPRRRA
jgi:3-phosphoshikimate 1-carboxyvinyltransferase